MSWFDEQIRQRCKMDDEMLNSSIHMAADAVLGNSFSFGENNSDEDINHIFAYFRLKTPDIPESITDPMERISYACRILGVMHRNVELTESWYKEAVGAMIARRADTKESVALIPGKLGGYYWIDKENHKKVRINAKNAGMFELEALSFYKPLPLRSITKKDLIKFCFEAVTGQEILFAIVFLLLATLLGLIIPRITFFLFSEVVNVSRISLLVSTVVFAVSTVVASALMTLLYNMSSSRIGTKITASVDSAIMMRVLSLPQRFFDDRSSGNISTRVNYIRVFCRQLVSIVIIIGINAVFSLAYFSQIVAYTPTLALPMLGIILLALGFLAVTIRNLSKNCAERMSLETRNHALSFDTITGIQKIRVSGSEKRMFSRFTADFAELAKVAYNPPFYIKIRVAIVLLITLAGQFLLFFLGISGKVSVPAFYASQSAYTTITNGITILAQISMITAEVFAYLELAKPILETAPETSENHQPVTSFSGAVELNKVYFRYDENMRDIISDLSFSIMPGEYVGLVGRSGCGKSTVIRLLLGFENPRAGTVSYDGKNLALLDKPSLRRKIGTVMQSDFIYCDSIFANIAVCSPGLTMEGAWKAAELAGIADTIRELPMGMFTIVSEDSGGFSGGQKQRLIIARAIASNPQMLIFDEATSALDNRTQKIVSDSLDSMKCTRLVVAHRLSTIKNCDRILVMDEGHIVEEGTYEQLISKNGLFAELVKRQRPEL